MTNDNRPAAVHWVLVADASRARLFASDLLFDALESLRQRRATDREDMAKMRRAAGNNEGGIHGE